MSQPPESELLHSNGQVKWKPKYVRLTDDAAIVSLCIHDKIYRATNIPWDFDSKGDIKKTVPVWKDWYIFTGRSNGSGWLLKGMVNRFMGGLVLPAKDPVFTVNIKFDRFEPLAGNKPAKDRIACAKDNKVYFGGSPYSHDPIIILSERENKGIIRTLREQAHFHPKIYEAADEHNPMKSA
ncbi:hypothetical protein N7447_007045 [Penicillium robsamsonii]|uniref:uncharacterized protein n=1 Tax=Penicillium robsamsonii TaxID=1792511 RepID=UPI002547858A|nr:uncharacterized protein N7447_007045 [Penicillium robsamsonii]KAJ5824705.1 hypothetical protein N7447_007045 [Penicillium robsamsonii]